MNRDELDARIDAALKQAPAWEPPGDFARRIAAMAARPGTTRAASWSLVPPGVFGAAMPALLLALAGCIFGLMPDVVADNATLMAWLSAGLTVWTALMFARRASA